MVPQNQLKKKSMVIQNRKKSEKASSGAVAHVVDLFYAMKASADGGKLCTNYSRNGHAREKRFIRGERNSLIKCSKAGGLKDTEMRLTIEGEFRNRNSARE